MARSNVKIVRRLLILSVKEVANICGVTALTVINWIRARYLKAFQTPGGTHKIYAQDLANLMYAMNMRLPPEFEKMIEEQVLVNNVVNICDNPDTNTILKKCLKSMNSEIQIKQVNDALEAGLLFFEKDKPDLIIIDVDIPGVNGENIISNYKASVRTYNPIIIVFGNNDPVIIEKMTKAGADSFLTRPVDIAKLQARIDTLVRTRRYIAPKIEQNK